MHSLRKKPRKPLTCRKKEKKKISEYGTERDESDRCESYSEKSEDGPSKVKSASDRKASTSANEQLR